MTSPTLILRKTGTAADYVRTHTPDSSAHSHATTVLRTLASLYAAEGPTDDAGPPLVRDLLRAVAGCAGFDWLQANTHAPDVRRLTPCSKPTHPLPGDPVDLDDLLATVLWTRHGPQPAPP